MCWLFSSFLVFTFYGHIWASQLLLIYGWTFEWAASRVIQLDCGCFVWQDGKNEKGLRKTFRLMTILFALFSLLWFDRHARGGILLLALLLPVMCVGNNSLWYYISVNSNQFRRKGQQTHLGACCKFWGKSWTLKGISWIPRALPAMLTAKPLFGLVSMLGPVLWQTSSS
jgi:hypothetical protein